MSDAGWFEDPSGRFGRRWYDGATWSEHVVGANGSGTTDPLGDRDTPYPPPAAGPRAEPTSPGPSWPPVAPAWAPPGPPLGPPLGPPPRFRPGAGLVVALVGLLLVAIGCFGPDWVKTGDSSFLTLGENARKATLPDDADANVVLAYAYLAWAGFVLLGLAVVLALAGLVPVPATSHRGARIAGALVAGVGGVLHAAAFGLIATDDRAFGSYLGFAGWYVVVVGFAIGVRQVGVVPLTGQRRARGPQPGAPA